MSTYDAVWFTPPAPVARVRLRNLETRAEVHDVPMLLDSGADVSLVPHTYVAQLGIPIDLEQRYEVVGFNGAASTATVVRLELRLQERTFRGQFLLTDQAWGILGRNTLNNIVVSLDGPRLTWTVPRTGKP